MLAMNMFTWELILIIIPHFINATERHISKAKLQCLPLLPKVDV